MFVPPAAAGSGGFAFDLPGVEESIGEWKKLLDLLLADHTTVARLHVVRGPGDEVASEKVAAKLMESMVAFAGYQSRMLEFVHQYVVKLGEARDEFLAGDGGVADTLGRVEHS